MGASTGNMLVDVRRCWKLFQLCADLVATHREDNQPFCAKNFREKYGADVPIAYHPQIPAPKPVTSSSLAVDLAKRHDTRLHVLHLTTARELELLGQPDHWMRSDHPRRPVCTTSSLTIATME